MIIIKIVGMAIITAILALVIKQEKPELAFLLSLLTGIIILLLLIGKIKRIIELIERLALQARVDIIYFNTIIKIVGIAYIGEFGAEITRDAGEKALAGKIEMAAKILIMLMALPIMISLIETIVELIP
ncbi:MAG: stage III sporulation protein AD [Halanaerobiales bacterium]